MLIVSKIVQGKMAKQPDRTQLELCPNKYVATAFFFPCALLITPPVLRSRHARLYPFTF